jgi:serine/threonine protein kinase
MVAGEITVDSFLDLLGQSDLVSDAQLLALTAEFLGENQRPESPQKLADELVRREVLTTWQSEMLLQGRHRGFRLGPYRILRPLGQGGMSKVYLAEHEMMRRRSAIKVLPSKYQEDKDLLNRFHLEARAVAALDHPNIVRAYDFNKDVRYGKEIHYLVMEYVEGLDLRRMVEDQGPLDFRKAADYMCQAALGLAHAHQAGFVHRDIKPANLLVDPHNVLKILDLGLATFTFEAENTLNPDEGTQSAVGTADYVAPEQVIDSRNVDGRADIYSLGLTFYYLLTGHRPFSKPTIMEVLMAHRTEKPASISSYRPDVPMDLEAIVEKMAAKSPRHRYQTAKEVAETLQKWQSDSGSARTYSRLSALMAEAARTKLPTPNDTTPTASPMASTELELKLVEDESLAPEAVAEEAASTDEATENDTLSLADVSMKDNAPAAGSGALPRAKPLDAELVKHKPINGHAAPKTQPRADTDLLASLFDAELPATPTGEPLTGLASAAGQLPPVTFATPKKSAKKSTANDLLRSPWVWIGLVVAVILVLIVVFLFAFSSPSRPSPVSPSVTNPEPGANANPPAPPAPLGGDQPPKTSEPSPVAPTPPPPATINNPPPATPPTPEANAVQKEIAPTPVAPPAETAIQQPAPASPEPPKEPPKELPPVVAPEKLLAEVTAISVNLTKSIDPHPKSALNRAIVTQAKGSAIQVDIKIVETSDTVMDLTLTEATADNKYHIILTAELKCPSPPDGKPVVVWSKSDPIYTVDLSTGKINPANVYNLLQRKGGEYADAFFVQFSTDVTAARAKFGK